MDEAEGVIKRVQQLRDAAENAGDLQGAQLYSEAISLMVEASTGVAGEPADEEDAPPDDTATAKGAFAPHWLPRNLL